MAQDGYTAPFALQDILTQKRLVQHQKLVDSLNVVQAQAEMENQAKQREQADAQMKHQAAQLAQQASEGALNRAHDKEIASMPPRQAPESIAYQVGPTGKITRAVDPVTGEPIKTRAADPRMELGFPPQPPASAQPYLHQVPDPNDPTKNVSIWLRPGEQLTPDQIAERSVVGGLSVRRGNELPDQRNEPSSAEFIKLADLAGKAATGPDRMFGMRPGKPADPAAVQAYTQLLDSMVVRAKTSPDIIEAVLAARAEPPEVSTAEIIADVKANGATDEELAQFTKWIIIARGQ